MQLFEEFLELPVNPEETWQGGVVSIASMLSGVVTPDAGDATIPLWRSVATELVHTLPSETAGASRFDAVVAALLSFAVESDFPFRPARLECNNRRIADRLSELLDKSGTTVEYVANMTEWEAVVQDMAAHLKGAVTAPLLPSLRDAGSSDRQIREFAEAAAEYYRAGLWDYLSDVDLLEIKTPIPPRGMKYAVVLGAASETYGIGFYNDAEDHYAIAARRANPRKLSLGSFTFESFERATRADVRLWTELELPLETGEGFPDFSFFCNDEVRRPSPGELEFTTVLLRALATTSEGELDSGRWTKSVELEGKQKRCTLTIPNLIDPPDRQEWIRRGMMPEPRGNERHFKLIEKFIAEHEGEMDIEQLNEAINAKFTGPIDELEFSTETAADRAEALCDEAINTFGRRRIQLAREALAEDPTHVESNLLLAEATRHAEQRIELFRAAMEAGRAQLGDAYDESVGHFWGVTETRPYMRACQGLAVALREAGQSNDAIDLYTEMLRLNPGDNQGIRYEVIPLLLEQDRDSEAAALLNEYREDSAFWHYTHAVVEFRRSGRSATAQKALRSAFRANEYVAPMLQSDEPPLLPDSYADGSPEEAANCIHEMADVWRESEGSLEWMYREFATWQRDKAKRQRDQKRRARKDSAKKKRKRK